MPIQVIIPTPAQRAHDAAISGGDNAVAIATANTAIAASTMAQNKADAAKTTAEDAVVAANDAVSAIGNTQIEAAEFVSAFVPVTIDGYNCHCTHSGHYGHLAGISIAATQPGFMIPIRRSGIVTNSGWSWPPLATIFCGPGGLTATPPNGVWIQAVGIAQSETSMLIVIGEPILLG